MFPGLVPGQGERNRRVSATKMRMIEMKFLKLAFRLAMLWTAAPAEIRRKAGQTIVQIGEDKGRYGLNIYSPNVPSSPNGPSSPGASLGLGFEGAGGKSGLILLKEGPNFTAKLGRDGLRLYKT